MSNALLLIGHGSRDPEGNLEFEALSKQVQSQADGICVRHAALEYFDPSIPQAVDSLVEEGMTRIDCIPYFLFEGRHVKSDIPCILDEIRRKHPRIDIRYGRCLGVDPKIISVAVERLGSVHPESAVVVVSRGSLEPEPLQDTEAVSRLISEKASLGIIKHCFIAIAPPDLPTVLKTCASYQPRSIAVLPYFLFTGVLVKRVIQISHDFGAEIRPHLGLHPNLVDVVLERMSAVGDPPVAGKELWQT